MNTAAFPSRSCVTGLGYFSRLSVTQHPRLEAGKEQCLPRRTVARMTGTRTEHPARSLPSWKPVTVVRILDSGAFGETWDLAGAGLGFSTPHTSPKAET